MGPGSGSVSSDKGDFHNPARGSLSSGELERDSLEDSESVESGYLDRRDRRRRERERYPPPPQGGDAMQFV
jgi:hypothetical protein